MEPFDPYPPQAPSESEPASPLSEPSIDEPPRLEADQAFAVGRALGNGWAALKRAPIPMFLAGFLMTLLDGSNGGNFNTPGGNRGYEDDGGYDDYSSELIDSIGHPARVAVTDAIGDVFTPAAALLQIDSDVLAALSIGIGALLCILVIVIAFWVARSFVKPGVIRLHSHILQTAEQQSVGVIFSGSDRFVAMLVWELLSGVIVFGTILVAMAPGGVAVALALTSETPWLVWVGIGSFLVIGVPALVYVGLGVSLGAHAVTLENRAPLEALRRSWRLASGNRWDLFVFYFVLALVQLGAALLGLLLCCVGLLVTVPAARAVCDFATTEAFLMLTRGREVTAYWKLWELQLEGAL